MTPVVSSDAPPLWWHVSSSQGFIGKHFELFIIIIVSGGGSVDTLV